MNDYPIAALKSNDDSDVEHIIEEHYNAIFNYCFYRVRQKEEAEDITQDVFLNFFKAIHHYKDNGKPRAYLFQIAKNLCINWSHKKKPQYVDSMEHYSLTIDDNEQNIASIDIEKGLQYLLEEEKEVILLRYMHDLPMEEICQILNTNRFAIRYKLNKALKKLKKYMEGVNK